MGETYFWIPLWIPLIGLSVATIVFWREARGFRFRPLLKWMGTITCALILVAAAMTIRWSFMLEGTNRNVSLMHGALYAYGEFYEPMWAPRELYVQRAYCNHFSIESCLVSAGVYG